MSGAIRGLFRHSSIYLLGNILNRIGAFLLLPLYTRYLTVAEYGTLELLYAITAVASSLLAVGLSHSTLRFYFDYPDDADRHRVISTNFYLAAIFSGAGGVVIALGAGPIAELLFSDAELAYLVRIAMAILFLELTAEILFAYLRAIEKSLLSVGIFFVRLLVQVSMSIYLVAFLDMGVDGVMFSNFMTVLLTWIFLVVYVGRRCGAALDLDKAGPILRYSIPFAVSGLMGVVMMNMDRFFLKSYVGLDAVGTYGLATKFALLVFVLLSEPFQRSYGAFRFSVVDKPEARGILSMATRLYTTALVVVALGIAVFVTPVLGLMSAPEYHGAADVVPLLLVATMATGLTYCFQTGIMVSKHTRLLVRVAAVVFVVTLVADIVLIPAYGIYGAALALLIGRVVEMLLVDFLSRRYYRVDYPYAGMIGVFSAGVAGYAAWWAIRPDGIGAQIGAGVLLMFATCAVLFVADPQFRRAVQEGYQRSVAFVSGKAGRAA